MANPLIYAFYGIHSVYCLESQIKAFSTKGMQWQLGLQQEGQLKQRGVNPYTIRQYHSFLTSQTQQVNVNATLSESRDISTGLCEVAHLIHTVHK